MTARTRDRRLADVPTSVGFEEPWGAARQHAEAFVASAFRSAYGADIRQFMPHLMTLRNDAGHLLAVLGLRGHGQVPFFLQQYLDSPVDEVLTASVGRSVDPQRLVEVGNFAVGAAGGGRWLITALTAYLYSAGQEWAVFTCGSELRNAFRRLGVPLHDLCAADPQLLDSDERDRWGSYYAQQPRVMAANVAESHAVLADLFSRECALNTLWQGALRAGRVAA